MQCITLRHIFVWNTLSCKLLLTEALTYFKSGMLFKGYSVYFPLSGRWVSLRERTSPRGSDVCSMKSRPAWTSSACSRSSTRRWGEPGGMWSVDAWFISARIRRSWHSPLSPPPATRSSRRLLRPNWSRSRLPGPRANGEQLHSRCSKALRSSDLCVVSSFDIATDSLKTSMLSTARQEKVNLLFWYFIEGER